MSIKNRLSKLESYRVKFVYPTFVDSYDLTTTAAYNRWMLDNNPMATMQDIVDLKVLNISDMY